MRSPWEQVKDTKEWQAASDKGKSGGIGSQVNKVFLDETN